MKMTYSLLLAALMLGLSSGAWAQSSPGNSLTPDAAASKVQGGDVLWYGKAPPGWGGVVGSMKLIAPGVGWAERGGRFYWTTDNGANWKDITPPLDADEMLSSIFFLDASTGWITINHYEPRSRESKSDLVSTTDGGVTWSRTAIPLWPKDYRSSAPNGFPFRAGAETVAFVDPLHGWINVAFSAGGIYSRSGYLLVTSDGGRTWSHPADAPSMLQTEMLLLSPSEGWLYGAEFDGGWHLYVTSDGTRSWEEVAPEATGLLYSEVHGLPTFEDAKHGFVQVNGLGGGDPERLTMELFATSDGGRTWKPDRTVANLNGISRHQYGAPTVVGSDWIFAAASDHHPVLTKFGPGAKIDASTEATASRPLYKDIRQISFATPTQAWAIVGDGYLMSTANGGATWTELTPGPQPHVIQPHGSFIPRQ